MKITYDFKEVTKGLKKYSDKVEKATQESIKEITVSMANDIIKIHPWKNQTGNNSRSIKYIIGKLKAEIFSTSGYGGILETGSRFMQAFPYFKPALDRNWRKFPSILKEKLRW